MAPLLSLNQLQAMRSLMTRPHPNTPMKEKQHCATHCVNKTALNLSAVGCATLKLLLSKINAAKRDTNIVTLNLEQVIGRSQLPMFERVEDLLLFEAIEDLLLCDDRAWHRMKFVDTIQVHEFDDWIEQKEAMLYHIESIAERCEMSVRLRLVVKVPCDTRASMVISFLKALLSDTTIKTVMISGALKYGDPTDVWKEVARIFRHPEMWRGQDNESATVEFHIFYDGIDKACDNQEEKSWNSDLRHCIHAIEHVKRTAVRKTRIRVVPSEDEHEQSSSSEVVVSDGYRPKGANGEHSSKRKRKPSSRHSRSDMIKSVHDSSEMQKPFPSAPVTQTSRRHRHKGLKVVIGRRLNRQKSSEVIRAVAEKYRAMASE